MKPTILNMHARLPNITQVMRWEESPPLKEKTNDRKRDIPCWGLHSGRRHQHDVQAPPEARCLPRNRRSSSSGYLTFFLALTNVAEATQETILTYHRSWSKNDGKHWVYLSNNDPQAHLACIDCLTALSARAINRNSTARDRSMANLLPLRK